MRERQRGGKHAATEAGSRLGSISGVPLVTLSGRVLVAVMSVAVLATTGMGWSTIGSLQSELNTTNALDPAPALPAEEPTGGDGATDILLVGSDSRTDAQGRPLPLEVLRELRTEEAVGLNTDTIILVRVPDDGTAAHAVSIPRDTYVSIAGRSDDKINSAYGVAQAAAAGKMRDEGVTDEAKIARDSAHAGRRVLVSTVQQLTGVRIDHYAELNLYGFALLTDAIGGVEVCLNAPTKDSGSGADFPAGYQSLSGGAALSFVRQRGGLPRGDLDRIVRQQVFMASAVKEVLSTGTLTDPTRLSGLATAAQRSVVLDDAWDILGFAQQMQGIAAGAVDFVTIPVKDIGAHDDRGQSIITVDLAEVKAFVAGLAHSSGSAPSPAGQTDAGTTDAGVAGASRALPAKTAGLRGNRVDVLNGTEQDGLAGEVSTKLVAAGLTADQIGNAPPRPVTTIQVAPGRADLGKQVADLLGSGIPVEESPRLAPDRIVVLLGSDYAALGGGQRVTGPPMLRLDGSSEVRSSPPQPPISAGGVPCIN